MNPSKLWQIVFVSDLNGDFDDYEGSEIAELQGSRNDIVEAADIALVAAHVQKLLAEQSEEHHAEFFDEEAPIEYITETDEEGNLVMKSKIDGEIYIEVTVYPVTVIKLPLT